MNAALSVGRNVVIPDDAADTSALLPRGTGRPSAAAQALLVGFLLGSAACVARPGGSETEHAQPLPSRVADTIRVLFIGNSYTYFNNLPEVLETIAADAGVMIDADMHARGGATLRDHLADTTLPRRLQETRWDVVIIQEQSTLGLRQIEGRATVADPESFLRHAQRLISEVRAVNAQPFLLLTWRQRQAAADEQDRLTHAYAQATEASGAALIPVGLAWERARRERPDLELYASDGSHPSSTGTYLMARAVLATIAGRHIDVATFHVQGHPVSSAGKIADTIATLVQLSEADARYLSLAAWTEIAAVRSQDWHAPALPAQRDLPQMPSGGAVELEALTGHWKGPFAFFRPTGSLTLKMCRARGGVDSVEVDFGGRTPLRGLARNLRVDSGQLHFTFGGDSVLRQEVRFTGTMIGDSLAGIAEYRDEGALSRATWRVGRPADRDSGRADRCGTRFR